MSYDEQTADRVRRALCSRGDVVETPMMGGLCFMVSGRMCCSVSGKGGLLIRLGPAATEALREPNVKPMKMGKRVMRGFVRVSPEGYQTDSQLDRWIQRGIECALAATPKRVRARR